MCILDPGQVAIPSGVVVCDDTKQGNLQIIVGRLHLLLVLWMEPRREAGRGPKGMAEGLSNLEYELRTPVRDNVSWDAVETEDMM